MTSVEGQMNLEDELHREFETAHRRRGQFLSSIPEHVLKREDIIALQVAKENASTNSRLKRVYLLADELMQFAVPHVACGRGCSSCCNMNITISQAEADRIGQAIGLEATRVPATIKHEEAEFASKPCPFLIENACSIYQDRPLVCRMHVSYAETASSCAPNRMNDYEMPLVRFSGLIEAIDKIANNKRGGLHADIRDFFGSYHRGE